MAESTPSLGSRAVFLSYASQDAEAARRICEALRGAGVEVWFDADGGLEHGDEWDAKIRRQIKECVLFIPIISANTQAREEGYFRLEWELAAQRSLSIASGVAFVLPVVIDDTREPEALAPDRFRAVQWTRLPGGEVPADVLQRFLKLWSHRTGALRHKAQQEAASSSPAPAAMPVVSRRRGVPWLLILALLALAGAALLGWRMTRPPPAPAPVRTAEASPPVDPDIQRATGLLDRIDSIPEDFRLAEDLMQRRLEQAPTDPATLSAMARVQVMWLLRGWDRGNIRYQKAKAASERALQLSPDSADACFASACYLYTRGSEPDRALELAQRSVELNPADARNHRLRDNCLFSLYFGLLDRGASASTPEELNRRLQRALAASEQTARLFPRDALVQYELGRHYRDLERWEDFERANDVAIAIAPVANAIVWKARARFMLHSDLPGMKRLLDQVPARVRSIERTVYSYFLYSAFSGDYRTGLEALNSMPEPWMIDFDYRGPIALPSAALLEMSGRRELARTQYEAALAEASRYVAAHPGDLYLKLVDVFIQHALGREEEARASLRVYNESVARPYVYNPIGSWWFQAIPANLIMGERATALELIRDAARSSAGRASILQRLKLDPRLEKFRADPEILALLAEPAEPKPALQVADDKSVAVLAFANLSDDKANEYFSDGISEELLNVLAKVPGLQVTARTSSFHFKGKDTPIPEIARQLGVAYVVEGSVRKAGDKVRITAQLIKAADGFHVWSDTFTRDLRDIFAVQDEIAALIAQNLRLSMGLGSREARRTVNPEAHQLVLEGRYFWNQRTAAGFARAETAFTKAIELDPHYAQAYAGLADVRVTSTVYDCYSGANTQPVPGLRAETLRALELDPALAEAYPAAGAVLHWSRQFSEAEVQFRKAIALNPNYALGHHWYSLLLEEEGRLDEAMEEIEQAVRLDPLSLPAQSTRHRFLFFAGRIPEALAARDRANALNSRIYWGTGLQAQTLLAAGRNEEALEVARGVLAYRQMELRWTSDASAVAVLRKLGHEAEARAHVDWLLTVLPAGSYLRGLALVSLDRWDEAEPYLEATPPGTVASTYFWNPLWDRWRDDPRFIRLLGKLHALEEYRVARERLARMQPGSGGQPKV